MENEIDQEELKASELLSRVIAVVFDNTLAADEIREKIRKILERAGK